MGKREENRKLKLCVLSKIKQKKKILFGGFSNEITKEMKKKEWKEITDYAKTIGVIQQNREWTYVRDVWWPNVRKLTMEKLDNAQKTGSRGGSEKMLYDIDMEVWDIMGKDSPVISGLDVPETSFVPVEGCLSHNSVEEQMPASPTPGFSGAELQFKESSQRSKDHRKTAAEGISDNKRDLQIELLKLNIYKSKLQCRKLEMELNLPKSSFTCSLPEPSEEIPVVVVCEDEEYFNF